MTPECKAPVSPRPLWTQVHVPLERIDLRDTTYQIRTQPCTEALVASIEACGLINPPLLRKQGERFSIISGFRRVAACRRCGFHRVQARLVSPDLDEADCIHMAVADNAFQGTLNPVEISRVVRLFSRCHPDPGQIGKASTRAGVPLHGAMVEKFMKVSRLPDPVQESLARGALTLSVAETLADLGPEAAQALNRLFTRLKLGFQLQREMIRLTTEIARREDLDLMEVLQAPDLARILEKENGDRVQKTRQIRWYLKKRRFPHLTEREAAFKKCLKALKLGPGVSVSPPADFEGRTFSLTLRFDSPDALSHGKAALDRILTDPDFKRFFST